MNDTFGMTDQEVDEMWKRINAHNAARRRASTIMWWKVNAIFLLICGVLTGAGYLLFGSTGALVVMIAILVLCTIAALGAAGAGLGSW